jgi:hypothetical protein|tara:strand:+ start:477 stop:644 length:168 start_codon:yes stop_codon:yes gene_type:complete
MKIGDLVRYLNFEPGGLGIIVELHHESLNGVTVAWNDGRVSPILKRLIEVISEGR